MWGKGVGHSVIRRSTLVLLACLLCPVVAAAEEPSAFAQNAVDELTALVKQIAARQDYTDTPRLTELLDGANFDGARSLVTNNPVGGERSQEAVSIALDRLNGDYDPAENVRKLNDCRREQPYEACFDLLRVFSILQMMDGDARSAAQAMTYVVDASRGMGDPALRMEDAWRLSQAHVFNGHTLVADMVVEQVINQSIRGSDDLALVTDTYLDWIDYFSVRGRIRTEYRLSYEGTFRPGKVMKRIARTLEEMPHDREKVQRYARYLPAVGELNLSTKHIRWAGDELDELLLKVDFTDHDKALVHLMLADSWVRSRMPKKGMPRYRQAYALMDEAMREQLFDRPMLLLPKEFPPIVIERRPRGLAPDERLFAHVRFVVDKRGEPRGIEVAESNVPYNLQRSCKTLVNGARFRPRLVGDEFVTSEPVTVEFTFVVMEDLDAMKVQLAEQQPETQE